MSPHTPDLLATKLAEAALTVLVRTCRKEVASALMQLLAGLVGV